MIIKSIQLRNNLHNDKEIKEILPLIERSVILENTVWVNDISCKGEAMNVTEWRWLEYCRIARRTSSILVYCCISFFAMKDLNCSLDNWAVEVKFLEIVISGRR